MIKNLKEKLNSFLPIVTPLQKKRERELNYIKYYNSKKFDRESKSQLLKE